jgi:hypothetical protein
MVATSILSAEGVCALVTVPLESPNTNGAQTAPTPATVSSSFFAAFSLSVTRFIAIASIRFLRSAPLMPETLASGDLRHSSHVLKMLLA